MVRAPAPSTPAQAGPTADALRPAPGDRPWLIMLSGSPWHAAAHRQQQLAREMTRETGSTTGYRVLFVDPPSNGSSVRFRVTEVDESLWQATVPSPLPFGRQLPPSNLLGRSVTALMLRRWLDRHPGDRLLWIDEDLASPMIGHLDESGVVYDATDLDWTFTRRWNRWHLRRALRSAVGRADLVLASSSALPGRLPSSRNPAIVVSNACDPEVFRPDGPLAPWLNSIPGPKLGYLGAVDVRAFDAGLVAAVAGAHPEWTFVLIGPSTAAGRAPLRGIPNVVLFDAVPFAETPSVMRGFDLGLIPYRVGGLIDYVHPKKCYEYLACGLPVVATPLPALRRMDGPIRLAAGPEHFAQAIAAGLAEKDHRPAVADRLAAARRNSWLARAEQLRPLLAGLTPPGRGTA